MSTSDLNASLPAIDVILYHDPCFDGTASAAIALKRFPQAILVGLSPTGTPPFDQCEGKHVLIVDLALTVSNYEILSKVATSIMTLDHHIGNENKLASVPSEQKCFCVTKCGAELTWDWCFPGQPYPLFLQLIRDRDLWERKLPESEDHATFLMTQTLSTAAFQEYLSLSDEQYRQHLLPMKPATQLRFKFQEALLKTTTLRMTWIDKQVYLVAYVENGISMIHSEVGSMVMERFPQCDFVAVYRYNASADQTHFSLRSTDAHEDVNAIAQKLGGGGHRNASAVTLSGCMSTLGPCEDHGEVADILEHLTVDKTEPRLLLINTWMHRNILASFLFRRVPHAQGILFYVFDESHMCLHLKCHYACSSTLRQQWCQRFGIQTQSGMGTQTSLCVNIERTNAWRKTMQ